LKGDKPVTADEGTKASDAARRFTLHDPAFAGSMSDYFSNYLGTLGTLRRECPVGRSEALGGYWVVTRHDDVARCLHNHDALTTEAGVVVPMTTLRPQRIPMNVDPPLHNLYRHDLNAIFSPPKFEALRTQTAARVREYIVPIVDRGAGDLVSELCSPFPCTTFLIVLGAPVEDTGRLVAWKDAFMAAIADEAARRHMVESVIPEVTTYFDELLDRRARAGEFGDDVISGLLQAKVGDRPYTREEMLKVCMLLTVAGLDTVTGMLSFMLWFLASQPDHRAQLVETPSLIPGAVEELLRFFATVTPARQATTDLEIGGVEVRKGEAVLLSLLSAGHDDAAFDESASVDFTRSPNRHLAFGLGVHRCLGSHLARMELQVAIDAIVELMPDFHLDPDYEPRLHIGAAAGIDELRVVIGR
jgi:cytochrome P450